jgi:hypothetical protein
MIGVLYLYNIHPRCQSLASSGSISFKGPGIEWVT